MTFGRAFVACTFVGRTVTSGFFIGGPFVTAKSIDDAVNNGTITEAIIVG
jgi:hypothetical protein